MLTGAKVSLGWGFSMQLSKERLKREQEAADMASRLSQVRAVHSGPVLCSAVSKGCAVKKRGGKIINKNIKTARCGHTSRARRGRGAGRVEGANRQQNGCAFAKWQTRRAGAFPSARCR
eukprot:318452-Pyramimonas_sp.AAC.1